MIMNLQETDGLIFSKSPGGTSEYKKKMKQRPDENLWCFKQPALRMIYHPTGAIAVLEVIRQSSVALSSLVRSNDERSRMLSIDHPILSNHA
ncbi:hypothetical protein PGT21_018159 [Puccinia graminis f. sp. tritici]|uniref:Uncharacterized protein n=1 Tax=Puccinia graminis f. sp. tritici TaxID=56615 RepID=A0A5B0P031_PUCGR|nr:hypothetical protein PGT21_018159 [Puccinia graminis f. sp. tritici]